MKITKKICALLKNKYRITKKNLYGMIRSKKEKFDNDYWRRKNEQI